MPLGLRVRLPDGTVQTAVYEKGVLTLRLDVVNTPKRTYAQISLNGSDPAGTPPI